MLLRRCAVLALLLGSLTASAATTGNDDSCDIAVAPAATLLLPYFEVDLASRTGETTIFSITNTDARDHIAHVTLWTDYAYPVVTFDIFLTGYDVQSINLYDVIARGRIAPPAGTGTAVSHSGEFSEPHPTLNIAQCGAIAAIPPEMVTRVQQALTIGRVPECSRDRVGSAGHNANNAIGYATIDVVGACGSPLTPADPAYYEDTLRYDNVLIGDYQQINSGQNFAQAAPLVHIRAIPEGGTARERSANPARYKVNFPRTFYSRYQSGATRVADARQPLPSVFASKWIHGGTGDFQTSLKIWREGKVAANSRCSDYEKLRPYVEVVTFDEQENAYAFYDSCVVTCLSLVRTFPSAGRHAIREQFPRVQNGALAGWLYLNLAGDQPAELAQAWVVTSLRAEGRYSVDIDAAALGNGCSPRVATSEVTLPGGTTIGPLPSKTP